MLNCSCVIINCIDFRFQNNINKLIDELNIKDDVDIINIPGGGAKIDEYVSSSGKTMIDISIELHNPKTIILTGHEDCGAKTTIEDLKKKQLEYKKRYPEKNIIMKWFHNKNICEYCRNTSYGCPVSWMVDTINIY